MRWRLLTFAVFTTLLCPQSRCKAEDWTEFRGPTGQGLSTASGLPLRWSETENVRWKVKIPGKAWSSPVVSNGRVYVTTAVSRGRGHPPPQSLRALCLRADDGEVVWNVEVFRQPGGRSVEIHVKNSHASPTPLLDGDRMYVHFGPYGTACLQTSGGRILWKQQQLQYAPNHGNGGSPALAGDKLVICCDGRDVQYVVGLDKRSGEIVWRTDRDTSPSKGFSFSTPLIIDVDGRQQAVCPASEAVFAYDPQTGREIWRVRYGEGYSVVPRPVFGHGLVYVCTGFGDQRLLAIDPTGTGDVTDSHVRWEVGRAVPRSSSVLLAGDELYLVDDGGIASCFDAKSGQPHWQRRIGGKFSASPMYAEGRVYFQDENGTTTVVNAGTEFQELAVNPLAEDGARTFASFAVVEDALLVRSETHLYRIED